MTHVEEFGNAHTINVANGRNSLGSLPNVVDVVEQNTAVKTVRKALGLFIAIGASLQRNDGLSRYDGLLLSPSSFFFFLTKKNQFIQTRLWFEIFFGKLRLHYIIKRLVIA